MFQKMIIAGNLGGDPEMRYMGDGTAVTNFSVATNRSWTNSQTGEPVKETTWFRVSVWGRQAETANQYLSKGRQVLIEGRLKADPETGGPRMWQRQDGAMSASYEITADTVRFIGGRDAVAGPSSNQSGRNGDGTPVETDDIPF